jgi:hypothetical protein
MHRVTFYRQIDWEASGTEIGRLPFLACASGALKRAALSVGDLSLEIVLRSFVSGSGPSPCEAQVLLVTAV